MTYRCKLVTADGAYKYINTQTRQDRIVMALMPTLRVNMMTSEDPTPIEIKRREYELWDREGKTLVYREVV